mgnify:FL=1
MKFIIKDRNGDLPDLESKVFEFESLEQFANWSVQIELPRHVLIPPQTRNSHYPFVSNLTDNWLIYCESDYD